MRLLEIVVAGDRREALMRLLDDYPTVTHWADPLEENRFQVNVLIASGEVEGVMDGLAARFEHDDPFRVVVLDVPATYPRLEKSPQTDPTTANEPPEATSNDRISREELYAEVAASSGVTRVWLAMTALSAIVAAVGLMRDSTPTVIGAMVIAPLLGPNVGLAMAATLGDLKLGRRALIANLTGVSMVLLMAILVGMMFEPDTQMGTIHSRTVVTYADVLVGLAAGAAGTIAVTSGVSTALVGVMVAVALLPPTVVCGLMVGDGNWPAAGGAALLLGVNIACVNLAGVATFLIRGLRPRTFSEVNRAKVATRTAVVTWLVVLTILVILMALSRRPPLV
ncbi:MAG: TIGR00341 family protein [Phycisphaeraceae bacterium]|nr:TIGR00341 family protein [Phycisphaeraceae bacterium]